MKLSYQMATPELTYSPEITAYMKGLDRGIPLLHACGYQGVEFMIRDCKGQDKAHLDRLLKENDLAITMLCTGEIWAQEHISLSDIDDAKRTRCISRFKEMIDFAAPYGAQVNIGRVRGSIVPGIDSSVTLERAVLAFKELSAYAADKGVTIILEPVNRLQCNFINSTAEGREVVDMVGYPNFRIMLDLFHMNIEDKNILSEIKKSKGYFSYVHVCDNNRLYPGSCGFDFDKIIAALRDVEYDGWLGAEIFQIPDDDICVQKTAETLLPLLKQ
jgi:sugar phosphate isomerase/epimerase